MCKDWMNMSTSHTLDITLTLNNAQSDSNIQNQDVHECACSQKCHFFFSDAFTNIYIQSELSYLPVQINTS